MPTESRSATALHGLDDFEMGNRQPMVAVSTFTATSSASRRCAAGWTTRTATRSCSWPRPKTRRWSRKSKRNGRDAPLVELTYNWDTEDYGEARYFGHLAYEVDDIYAACDQLMKAGVTINRPPRDGVHGVRTLARQALDRAAAEGRAAAAQGAVGVDAEYREVVRRMPGLVAPPLACRFVENGSICRARLTRPSSSGLGRRPFTAETRVRFP